jgi:hypothetical protein
MPRPRYQQILSGVCGPRRNQIERVFTLFGDITLSNPTTVDLIFEPENEDRGNRERQFFVALLRRI